LPQNEPHYFSSISPDLLSINLFQLPISPSKLSFKFSHRNHSLIQDNIYVILLTKSCLNCRKTWTSCWVSHNVQLIERWMLNVILPDKLCMAWHWMAVWDDSLFTFILISNKLTPLLSLLRFGFITITLMLFFYASFIKGSIDPFSILSFMQTDLAHILY